MRKLKLKPREELRLRQGHLWVFSNEVDTKTCPLSEFQVGEEVNVVDYKDQVLGSATINPHTLICARIHAFSPNIKLNGSWLLKRLKEAWLFREKTFKLPWYRLVHGEGDLLPGLVIDRYGAYFSVQITTQAMELRKNQILEILEELFHPRGLILANDLISREIENLPQEPEFAGDIPSEIELPESGAQFLVPLKTGQKTGWFYDQRANRFKASLLAKKRKVLDVCCYLGGFGVLAGMQGALEVTFLDSSELALQYADKNFKRNLKGKNIPSKVIQGDVFTELTKLEERGERFDFISLDPPAFIKRRKDVQTGLSAYRKLNALALKLLEDGGILVTSSCSHHLTNQSLLDCVQRAAIKQQKLAQILYVGRQDLDHPELLGLPETSYLKCFMLRLSNK